MAISCSILAWNIPWTESGGLRSTGLQRDTTEAPEHACTHIYVNLQLLVYPSSEPGR